MSSTDEHRQQGTEREPTDHAVSSYGALLSQPFAASILDPRQLRPRLALAWIWVTLAMATFGCIANRALDRHVDSTLSGVQPAVSVLATLTAVLAVGLVAWSAVAHRPLLKTLELESDAFFAKRDDWMRFHQVNPLTTKQADAIARLTTEEAREVGGAARQVVTLLGCAELLLILSATVVMRLALEMGEALTQVLSWLDLAAMCALLLAVLPIIDNRMRISLRAASALRHNQRQVGAWAEQRLGEALILQRLEPTWRDSLRAPGTVVAVLWLVTLLVYGLLRSA